MSVGDVCDRDIVIAEKSMSVAEATQLMRDHQVSNLLVVEKSGSSSYTCGMGCASGIVSNREIVAEIMATGMAPDCLTIGEVVSRDIPPVQEDESLHETLRLMRELGVLRMPVVDQAGEPVGIVRMDSLVTVLDEERV